MNDRQLSLFIAVADQGSFSKAEAEYHLSKQAIIAQINALEGEIGVPLLTRTTNGVRMTEAGCEFYRGVKEMIARKQELLARVRMRAEGPCLRLAAIEHHVLLRAVMEKYRAMYPQVRVEECFTAEMDELELVREGVIDIGEVVYSKGKRIGDLIYTKIMDAPYLCVMREDHPLAGRKQVSIQALAGNRVVHSRNKAGGLYSDELHQALAACTQVERRPGGQTRKAQIVREVCESGAIYLSPSPFLRKMKGYAVIPLDAPFTQEYGVVFARNPRSEVRAFVELACAMYSTETPA